MNRYESAYRDYTIQRGEDSSPDETTIYPQRPERSKSVRMGRGMIANSDSSAESQGFDQQTSGRMMMVHANAGFSSTDEDSFIHQHPHQHPRHHQISSRELSDRSGGERSNPDFLVANDAIQTYQR